MQLLDKLRTLNTFMQKTAAEQVDFNEIGAVLGDIIDCNVFVLSRRGKILGHSFTSSFECEILQSRLEQNEEIRLSDETNQQLLGIRESSLKQLDEGEECFFLPEEDCPLENKYLAIIPASAGQSRRGTLMLSRLHEEFSEEDLVLGEYGATVVALEIIRSERERQEAEMEQRIEARIALNTLSYSEMEMVSLIFEQLDGDEQILVMSEIADQAEISRSVAVNALNKLESAGILESRSLGMKGTHIKVLNEKFREELNKREEAQGI